VNELPPLEGLTSVSAERNLRTDPRTDAKSLGEQIGHSISVLVLDKAEGEKFLWFQIELLSPLSVNQGGKPAVLPKGTQCWVVSDGLDQVTAPWDFFRYQLIQLEKDQGALGLDDRITKLRQMSHSRKVPFDAVIETKPGSVYLEDLPFVPKKWQLLRDYQAVRAPDGRIVDVHHLLVGLDVLHRPERDVVYLTFPIGTNYAAATWAGDLGAGAADMTLRFGVNWEKRNPRATAAERADYYFSTRAAEWDLLADVDAWGIQALRTPNSQTIDALLATYYQETTPGGFRTLTVGRRGALERFLAHYGFTYEYAKARYPALTKQSDPVRRVLRAIELFGRIWLFNRDPARLTSRDESKKRPAPEDVTAMTTLFLYWLEYQTIENGAEVVAAKP
jgi:hypothetical protein